MLGMIEGNLEEKSQMCGRDKRNDSLGCQNQKCIYSILQKVYTKILDQAGLKIGEKS